MLLFLVISLSASEPSLSEPPCTNLHYFLSKFRVLRGTCKEHTTAIIYSVNEGLQLGDGSSESELDVELEGDGKPESKSTGWAAKSRANARKCDGIKWYSTGPACSDPSSFPSESLAPGTEVLSR